MTLKAVTFPLTSARLTEPILPKEVSARRWRPSCHSARDTQWRVVVSDDAFPFGGVRRFVHRRTCLWTALRCCFA